MKKLFTTLFIAMLTMVAYAQFDPDPTMLTFKTFTQGNNPLVFNCDNMFMYVVDNKGKMECDEHIRTFKDGKRFNTRLKTQGTTNRQSQIFLSIKALGTLTLYASSASSEADRQIVILKGAKDIVTDVVEQSNKRPIVVNIDKVGEYQISYPDGAINIYGIRFVPKVPEISENPEEKK
jgi:hypothetical protein